MGGVRIRQSIPLVTTLLALTAVGGRPSAELSGYLGLHAVRLSRVTISDARQVSTKATTVLAHVKITRSGSECVLALKNLMRPEREERDSSILPPV